MAASKLPNELMFEKLAEGLDSTSKLTHALLTEIRESEADFAAIKTELAILRENVKGLSNIVREGNGATSLLTKIALIEQRIESVDKWMDNHVDSHQRIKNEISDVKEDIEAIEKSNTSIKQAVEQIQKKLEEDEREQRDSIHRAIEIDHIEKKSAKAIKEERQKAFIKIAAAIAIALVTFLITWYAKDAFSKNDPPPNHQQSGYHETTTKPLSTQQNISHSAVPVKSIELP
jgi:phage terminase small subunit